MKGIHLTGSNHPQWNGGSTKLPEYMNYRNMIRRGKATTGPYAGVKVCKRWRENFWNFYDDMGAKPTNGRYTVDRIDNSRGYEPSNCRWATASEQLRNRRKYHHRQAVAQ